MWIKCKTHSISFFLKTGTLIESNFHMFVDILKLNFPSITYMYISQQILKDCLLKYRKSKPTGIYTLCLMENITRHEGKITRIYCRRLSTHIARRNNIFWNLEKALFFFLSHLSTNFNFLIYCGPEKCAMNHKQKIKVFVKSWNWLIVYENLRLNTNFTCFVLKSETIYHIWDVHMSKNRYLFCDYKFE